MRKLTIIKHLQPTVPALGILTNVEQLASFDMIYIYHHLSIGSFLDLKREKNHFIDKNAVQVYFKGFKIGYLSQKISSIVAPRLDKGIPVAAKIKSVDKLKYLPLKGLDVELSF
jgi:hypothetical protein